MGRKLRDPTNYKVTLENRLNLFHSAHFNVSDFPAFGICPLALTFDCPEWNGFLNSPVPSSWHAAKEIRKAV
jgi:hypothetical protein